MGVTLERVQNKFACIIGELCSEPVILSQFAIWVDLRIAEYKAKGAISLDCSGDEPEPVWLNGHRLPKAPRNDARERIQSLTPVRKPLSRPHGHTSLHSSPSSNFSPSATDPVKDEGFLGETRLSPSLVVVKDEPSSEPSGSCVFPTSMHAHMPLTPSRKRPATETLSQGDSNVYQQQNPPGHSPGKVQRLSSTGESPHPGDTTSNQSLMSIISGDIEEHNQVQGDLNDRDIDIILDYESKNKREDNSSITTAPVLPEPSSSSSAADMGDSFNQSLDNSNNTVGRIPSLVESGADSFGISANIDETSDQDNSVVWALCESGKLSMHKREVKRRLLENRTQVLSTTTKLNIIGAVAAFECWLTTVKQESREIEALSPTELDPYLAEFFPLLKRRNRVDYDPDSFTNFRSFIARFLRDKKYPYSIHSSPEFSQCQAAFKVKRKELERTAVIRRMTQAKMREDSYRPGQLH